MRGRVWFRWRGYVLRAGSLSSPPHPQFWLSVCMTNVAHSSAVRPEREDAQKRGVFRRTCNMSRSESSVSLIHAVCGASPCLPASN